MEKYNELMAKLSYKFKEPNLLRRALTHRSIKRENNERLEFVGDSILNFVIARALFDRFPRAKEGELSRLRSKLVRGDTLAQIGKELGIGEHLRLGQGELKSGGRQRNSIIADALEAVIAAIYFDSDLMTCQKIVEGFYAERLAKTKIDKTLKDAKTQLQEYLQSKGKPLPNYAIKETEGDLHAQKFIVTCKVDGLKHIAEGRGTSRRRAEQSAAELYLKELKAK